MRKIKVGIIGCGLVADQHAEQLKYLSDCELVAACDIDELMARQLADRYQIPNIFSNPEEMLKKKLVDAVHITTPPQFHFSLGKLCLEAGCHVYIEKPFTIDSNETEELLNLSKKLGRKITVGHNLQFTPEALEMKRLIKEGFLGGPPIHIESIQCFSYNEPTYGKPVLSDPNHWVRRLPGSLPHNLISHGIAKIAEFLDGESPKIISINFSSPYLIENDQEYIIDEIRAIIQDEKGTTAFFLFTTQFGVTINELRLFGKAGTIVVDNFYRTILSLRPSKYKSYLRFFFEPLSYARGYIRNSVYNVRKFLNKEFQIDYGMRKLMELFYNSILKGDPDPISHDEIKRTARIMDSIFQQMFKIIK